ncbi:SwmB domain-containing protein [Tamlana sp. I1]|uniref:SwmB domain-containing protein n=1 Tax=Tamlana sp. I1 TaxID=2762061 RepID=UPI0018904310|nr:SwmB domain-containing protein [Tamlana sp. I1]
MKLNKNIAKYLFLAVLGFTACNEDDELNLQEPSQRVIYTSQMDFDNQIEVGNYITFGDVSPGVSSRTWTFPENITSVKNGTSSDDIVKAYFNKSGQYDVKLHQVFKKDAYVDETLMGKELDTTIVVTVFEPLNISIKANYINPDGTLGADLNISDKAENVLEASRSVRYTYAIAGGPQNTLWTFDGGTPETVENTETIDVKYKKMGTFNLELSAGRERPFGEALLSLENFIKVVPSTDPVTLDGVFNDGESIALDFSREMDPATLNAADFSVTIDNKGTILTPSVATATINESEGTRVLLTLDNEAIYNDDTITVSYTPGNLTTLDGVKAEALIDEPLVFVGKNIFDNGVFDYGFETTMDTDWKYRGWGAPWDNYTLNISEAQAYDGDKSAYVVVNPGGGMIVGQNDAAGIPAKFNVEAGKSYELGVWIYVESLGTILDGVNPPDVRFYWNPGTDWSVGGNPTFTVDYQVGQWVYSSQIVSFFDSGEKAINIRGDNQNNPQALKFYMDNLTLIEANLRP